MRFTAFLLLLTCPIAFACSGPESESRSADDGAPPDTTPAAPASAPIRTDSTAYSLRPDGPGWATGIGFTYSNPGADTVYVVNCNGAILMNLQKRAGSEWTDAWHAEGDQCLSQPLIVAPGQALRGEVRIWGAAPGNPSYNTFTSAELDGEYRLVWHQPVLHYDPRPGRFGDTISLADRVSNAFTLTKLDPEP